MVGRNKCAGIINNLRADCSQEMHTASLEYFLFSALLKITEISSL
jgi:hypothetical protein